MTDEEIKQKELELKEREIAAMASTYNEKRCECGKGNDIRLAIR